MIKHAFKCNFLCVPFLLVEETQHCLTGVKLHATLMLLLSHRGGAQGSIGRSHIASWLGGHADPVINRLGPPLRCAEPTKAQTQCILMGWR